METEDTIPSSFQFPSRSQEPESKTQKKIEPAAGEQTSWYKFYLRAQTKLKPRRKLKHMFQFPSQSQSRRGLLTIESYVSSMDSSTGRLTSVCVVAKIKKDTC
jgi:hypothetical protein